MLRKLATGIAAFLLSITALAETIRVGLEPFPPLIVDKNTGHTIKLLKAIEAASNLQFEIDIMPYNRAKIMLKDGEVDLIGHTPYGTEVKDFYEYAQELNFKVDVKTDLFVMDEKKFADVSKLKIGVPRGNESFAAEVLGLPVKNFYVSGLENLLQMLEAGRIDAFWFERASTMESLRKLKIKNVYYMEYPRQQLQVGLAVRNLKMGSELKAKMEKILATVNQAQFFADFNVYAKLPNKGVVNPSSK